LISNFRLIFQRQEAVSKCSGHVQHQEDKTEVTYQTSTYYAPEHGRGVRWNDPAFNIPWPSDDLIMLDRDRNYQDFVA